MSSLSDPDAYRVTTTDEGGGGGCGAPWFWIILFIVALLVIAALIVGLVYGWRRVTKNRVIEFKGANIKVSSPTSLTGTWPSTGKTNDKVTLWATLDPPVFESDGTISNSNALKAAAASGADSVTLPGLQLLKYYATLTVTNSDTANYQSYTQLVYMDVVVPTSTTTDENLFAIEDMIQVGKVQLETTEGTILFKQKPSEPNSLWKYVGGLIKDQDGTTCLYNNNGTLASKPCSDLTDNLNNSKWTYNQGKYANQWCLSNTTNTDNPVCMSLGSISSGTATISVTSSTNAGDAFVNAFEIAPASS